ncbi:A disintegrin and metalloproteinase with thrombospondin motifs 16-like [Anneissia japonica]|uniref:A disintegrin and metalloproteinase with thrombospondin motifs 16-like n=1 Tax=Anneissia japonica TaxID=1529436 RepID=UPI0014254EB7|nr:A disintegrin and metalloproteinase with thrombospondin motifs 16-like [Anneissia japonica]
MLKSFLTLFPFYFAKTVTEWLMNYNRSEQSVAFSLINLTESLNTKERDNILQAFKGFATSSGSALALEDEDYQIVIPFQVNSKGSYLSHNLYPSRKRRGLSDDGKASAVHYKVEGFGEEFHLELSINDDLVAPGFAVQRRKNGNSIMEEYIPEIENCHFSGHSRHHEGSKIAVSLCNGLTGLIRTAETDYLIQPLPEHIAVAQNFTAGSDHSPHIIYKRSADIRHHKHEPKIGKAKSKKDHFCGRKKKFAFTGLIRTTETDYFIQPLPEHIALAQNFTAGSDHSPHIIYKRSAAIRHHKHEPKIGKAKSKKDHFCGRKKKYMPTRVEEPLHFIDEYPVSANRTRRSIAANMVTARNVGILVVVDPKMVESHGDAHITTYVLTVFNMVKTLFHDSSIGSSVNFILVSLVILHDEEPGLQLTHHADNTLNSFCQWQSTLTTPNGSKHDHAILMTGMDICSWKNEPCDTLGFAPIGGMCSKYRSCTVNEDTGLGLAFTVAHESGHSFGMVHDGDGNDCTKSSGHIMSPTLSGSNGRFMWSQCSQTYLDEFFNSEQALCLEDEPVSTGQYDFPKKMPGEIYDPDTQCKWQFGKDARLCSFDFGKVAQSVCKSLWCHQGHRRCETKYLPAADGTMCGTNKWCVKGLCLDHGNTGPSPIDGGWSKYGDFSECSRTCGGGVRYQERKCNNPDPQYGGKFCEGPSRIYSMCNTQECTENIVDFREQQCAAYNSKPFRGFYYEWKPYLPLERRDMCKLYCRAQGFDFYFALSSKVRDGTRCSNKGLDVCINGRCEVVGCDHLLGSGAKEDACGVCRGDNSTCDFVKGEYHDQHATNNYYSIVEIPSGSRNIKISEKKPSPSYLAVRSKESNKYYLTGSWTIDWPGQMDFGGSSFMYKRSYTVPESLEASGPTSETLVLELLLQGINPGIEYEFVSQKIPEVVSTTSAPAHNYIPLIINNYHFAGHLQVSVQCWMDDVEEVEDSFCDLDTKPFTGTQTCNEEPCPAMWEISEWSECSAECGGGKRRRKVSCVRQMTKDSTKRVKTMYCTQAMPDKRQDCNNHECPPKWIEGPWSQVYVLTIISWSECSATCGPGKLTRVVSCSYLDNRGQYRAAADSECRHLTKPAISLTKHCQKDVCYALRNVQVLWYSSSWSKCTRTCGGGVQIREVRCLEVKKRSTSNICNMRLKPAISQRCNTNSCPRQAYSRCKDEYNWCYLVPTHNMCSHKFYGAKCCNSCMGH